MRIEWIFSTCTEGTFIVCIKTCTTSHATFNQSGPNLHNSYNGVLHIFNPLLMSALYIFCPYTFCLLCANILLSILFLNALNLCSALSVRDQVSHIKQEVKL